MLAIDWGTTSFRAYRLDAEGKIVDSRSAPAGILSVENGKFAEALEQHAGDWISAGETPIVMSGMIGSRQAGWKSPMQPVLQDWMRLPRGCARLHGRAVKRGLRRVYPAATKPACRMLFVAKKPRFSVVLRKSARGGIPSVCRARTANGFTWTKAGSCALLPT